MSEFNSENVTTTLSQLIRILEKHKIQYLFLGSVVTAAINGKLHRDLGDLDLIIEKRGKDALYRELSAIGYKRADGMFYFARKYLFLETLEAENMLGIGYFYGEFLKDGPFVMVGKRGRVVIDKEAIKPQRYSLYNITFFGLPKEVIATGVFTSKENPKRKKELTLLKEKHIEPLQNNYIHVSLFGMQTDWLYYFSMDVLNLIGGLRIKLGLAFDPWR